MSWEVHHADCLDAMREMDEASVDAIVTDPPYGLEFMGKEWDRLEGARIRQPSERDRQLGSAHNATTALVARNLPDAYVAGPRMQTWHQAWATEALRVLKPGGHLLAFGGTRTYHRLACAIEDAGFEIRDCIAWLYGSGFPKSLDVSKAIDKAAGVEREIVGIAKGAASQRTESLGPYESEYDATLPATPEAQRWQGWGTALKPAHEPIVVARKPLIGTVAANVLEHGTGALNVDGCRIEGAPRPTGTRNPDVSSGSGNVYMGIGSDGATQARYDECLPGGRWPANVTLSHLPECEQVGTRRVKGHAGYPNGPRGNQFSVGDEPDGTRQEPWQGHADADGLETVAAWRCASGCPVAELDRQSGERMHGAGAARDAVRDAGGEGLFGLAGGDGHRFGDTGGASRFFYVAKASRAERNAGLDGFEAVKSADDGYGSIQTPKLDRVAPRENWKPHRTANNHPTVKPIDLMRWLVRLVTPKGGTVLDPFTGSGSTGCAAVLEGFDFIGIEREAEYCDLARARIAWWEQFAGRPTDEILIAQELAERIVQEHRDRGQMELLPWMGAE